VASGEPLDPPEHSGPSGEDVSRRARRGRRGRTVTSPLARVGFSNTEFLVGWSPQRALRALVRLNAAPRGGCPGLFLSDERSRPRQLLIQRVAALRRGGVIPTAKRGGRIALVRRGREKPLRTAKVRALAKANPIRPRYAQWQWSTDPEEPKPVIGGEEVSKCTRRTARGGWGERASKEELQDRGDPGMEVRGGGPPPAGNQ
jgi:hypothetical protein